VETACQNVDYAARGPRDIVGSGVALVKKGTRWVKKKVKGEKDLTSPTVRTSPQHRGEIKKEKGGEAARGQWSGSNRTVEYTTEAAERKGKDGKKRGGRVSDKTSR